MATVTVAAKFATLTGTAISGTTDLRASTTAGTVVIDTDRFDNLILLGAQDNSTATVAITIESDSDYSAQGQGDATWTIGTAAGAIMGVSAAISICTPLETARFKSSGGTLILTIPALPAGSLYIGAFKIHAGVEADFSP